MHRIHNSIRKKYVIVQLNELFWCCSNEHNSVFHIFFCRRTILKHFFLFKLISFKSTIITIVLTIFFKRFVIVWNFCSLFLISNYLQLMRCVQFICVLLLWMLTSCRTTFHIWNVCTLYSLLGQSRMAN